MRTSHLLGSLPPMLVWKAQDPKQTVEQSKPACLREEQDWALTKPWVGLRTKDSSALGFGTQNSEGPWGFRGFRGLS